MIPIRKRVSIDPATTTIEQVDDLAIVYDAQSNEGPSELIDVLRVRRLITKANAEPHASWRNDVTHKPGMSKIRPGESSGRIRRNKSPDK
jgi:hypothetical protein